jgi:hypothetical protein
MQVTSTRRAIAEVEGANTIHHGNTDSEAEETSDANGISPVAPASVPGAVKTTASKVGWTFGD